MRIRRATRADLDALVALEEATFTSDRISRRQWRHLIGSASAGVLAGGGRGAVHAVAVVLFRRGSRNARLYSLAVRTDQRGHGLGRLLLAAVEDTARRRGCCNLHLEVAIRNRAAIALYARSGYQRGERLRNFYEDGGDAWRYRKPLAPA